MVLQQRARKKLSWGNVVLIGIPVVFLAWAGWYVYRWYSVGDPLPVDIPLFVTADPSVDESDVTPAQVEQHVVGLKEPRYISIPSLGIQNTRVFGVGLVNGGMLDSPSNINDAAWYTESDTPGSGGAVLIDGHNGGVRRDGIFSKLNTLQPGDTIQLERGDGQIFTYSVRQVESMPIEEVNATGMASMLRSIEKDTEGLNIITCDGKWVPSLGQFDRRIMLRAVLAD